MFTTCFNPRQFNSGCRTHLGHVWDRIPPLGTYTLTTYLTPSWCKAALQNKVRWRVEGKGVAGTKGACVGGPWQKLAQRVGPSPIYGPLFEAIAQFHLKPRNPMFGGNATKTKWSDIAPYRTRCVQVPHVPRPWVSNQPSPKTI